jgi:hypothetical protein
MRSLALLAVCVAIAFVNGDAFALSESLAEYTAFTLLDLAEVPQTEEVYAPEGVNFYRLEDSLYPEYDAALFAWRESYILDAFLDLFEISGDPYFLNVFQKRVSKVLSLLEAHTQGDFLSTYFSEELLSGEDFWECVNGSGDKDGRSPFEGSTLRIDLRKPGLSPGKRYTLRFWILCPGKEFFSVKVCDQSERYRGVPRWRMYFKDFEYQGEEEIAIEVDGKAAFRGVSLRMYREAPLCRVMLLKTVLRGLELGCSLPEQEIAKVGNLFRRAFERRERTECRDFAEILPRAALALACLRWGKLKNDADALAFARDFAHTLQAILVENNGFSSRLEEAFGTPGTDVIPEFVAECLKSGVVFSEHEAAFLARLFLKELQDRRDDVSPEGTERMKTALFPGWIALVPFEERILQLLEEWLDKNLPDVFAGALWNTTHTRLAANLTRFLLMRKLLEEESR